jgi:hypothetical protein
MARLPIPEISGTDYPEFRRICRGLPPTHAEWQSHQRHYHRRDRANGHETVFIAISPAEVENYCEREACSVTTDALYCLAQEKAIAKS